MYYDHQKADHEKRCAEKYDELKRFMVSINKKGKVNEWFLAYEHIMGMERELIEKQKLIEKYGSFFRLFRELLPRESSIHDIIG